jgi:hypothetical protein
LATAIPLELGTRCPEQRPGPYGGFPRDDSEPGEGSHGRLTQA